ncbi:hypothetical protein PsYK624_146700 [Phanerochaete sordida]|uniref:Uncharacterized protein n=1 Tax=Phanerochaete sordida TaxID=48140 RepID=A0A9P3LKK6_9APHY|nr:hypothetical protein PsYK624_146700 [Phanerochaete sordida]
MNNQHYYQHQHDPWPSSADATPRNALQLTPGQAPGSGHAYATQATSPRPEYGYAARPRGDYQPAPRGTPQPIQGYIGDIRDYDFRNAMLCGGSSGGGGGAVIPPVVPEERSPSPEGERAVVRRAPPLDIRLPRGSDAQAILAQAQQLLPGLPADAYVVPWNGGAGMQTGVVAAQQAVVPFAPMAMPFPQAVASYSMAVSYSVLPQPMMIASPQMIPMQMQMPMAVGQPYVGGATHAIVNPATGGIQPLNVTIGGCHNCRR